MKAFIRNITNDKKIMQGKPKERPDNSTHRPMFVYFMNWNAGSYSLQSPDSCMSVAIFVLKDICSSFKFEHRKFLGNSQRFLIQWLQLFVLVGFIFRTLFQENL